LTLPALLLAVYSTAVKKNNNQASILFPTLKEHTHTRTCTVHKTTNDSLSILKFVWLIWWSHTFLQSEKEVLSAGTIKGYHAAT
jgi:hypothetical protein